MPRMTDEEALELTHYFANNEITLGPNGSDWLSQREIRLLGLQNITLNYLLSRATALQKSPVEIIDELVSKEIAAASA